MGLGGTITSTIYRKIDCGNGSWEFKFWLDEKNSGTTILLYGNTEERYLEIAVVRNVGMEGYFFVNSYAGGEPDTIGYLMPSEITSGWHTLYLYIYDSSVVAYLDNESSLIAGNTAITENKSLVVWEASNRNDDYTDEVMYDYFKFTDDSYSYLESYDYEVNVPDITGDCLAESISCESNFSAITPNVSCDCTIDSLMYESMYESMVPLIQCDTVMLADIFSMFHNLSTPILGCGATISPDTVTSLYNYLSPDIHIHAYTYALTQTSTYTQINPSISTSINLTSGISNSNFNALSSDIKCGCTIEINTTTTINIETQTPTLINGCTTTLTPLETQYLIQSPIIKINLTTHTTPIESYYDILTPKIYIPPSQVYKYKFIIDRNIPLQFTVDKNKKYQFIVDPKQNWVFIMEDNE